LETAIAFLASPGGSDYGRRIWRLRWRRAFPADREAEISPDAPATAELSGADAWLLVLDERAQPLPSGWFPVPAPGTVLVPSEALPAGKAVHTLRELEEVSAVWGGEPVVSRTGDARWPAVAFRAADFSPCPGETVAAFADRLLESDASRRVDPAFRALSVGDPSELERPELTARVPGDRRRLLDVGCGSGGTAAALARRIPGLSTTGIERDPHAAARAEKSLDSVIRADAGEALARLEAAGERFDAFLFADVLEHLDDPGAALKKARAIASPGALLIASVPNAGHLSLARDLAAGRFDPVPAGLADVGHLRWFTRASLAEFLEESGWSVVSVEGEKGAAPPDAEEFEKRLTDWPGIDRVSLETYQWIAVAAADPDSLLRRVENTVR
jgi:2-polyprenyl-3-methyl-5-hydroxy-6-metoxy-1,4-benzoquinol methylase